jgi:hypothetical protein
MATEPESDLPTRAEIEAKLGLGVPFEPPPPPSKSRIGRIVDFFERLSRGAPRDRFP